MGTTLNHAVHRNFDVLYNIKGRYIPCRYSHFPCKLFILFPNTQRCSVFDMFSLGCAWLTRLSARLKSPRVVPPPRPCRRRTMKGKLVMQTRGSKFLKFQEVKIQELVRCPLPLITAHSLYRQIKYQWATSPAQWPFIYTKTWPVKRIQYFILRRMGTGIPWGYLANKSCLLSFCLESGA